MSINDLTTADTFSLMPENEDQVQSFAVDFIQRLLAGDIDFRKALIIEKSIKETLETIFGNEDVKEMIQGEIEKYGKEGLNYEGVNFKIGSRKSYDYSQTADTMLFDLERQREDLDNQIKGRKMFLNVLRNHVADATTGEVIYPPAYKETTFIRATKEK